MGHKLLSLSLLSQHTEAARLWRSGEGGALGLDLSLECGFLDPLCLQLGTPGVILRYQGLYPRYQNK